MNRSHPVCATVAGLMFFLAAARGEPFPQPAATQSVSGQFSVSALPDEAPVFPRPKFSADASLLRLEPALVAVSAEHFKNSLWQ